MFFKRYATQTSFGLVIAVFLTVTVGEGQAFTVSTPKVAAQIELQNDGFVGKTQLFSGQTILTGEVQQVAVIIYTVEKGDSVVGIANRYDLSVGSVLDANNIKPIDAEKIQPGEELIIPAEDTNTSLAWLDSINQAKAEQARLAEEARQSQLSQNSQSFSVSSYGGYSIIGTFWGGYNGGYPGQCTWWANYKRPDLPNGMGNGGQYVYNARRFGLATGSTPRAGALVSTWESYVGHVAYVESVNWSAGTITVNEMNYVAPGVASRRTISMNSSAIIGYVY
ncbi:MAG: CHAP domain-containing protein [Patescibacteria group bacterium]